ncbi:MAG TPA: hypothetical protein VEO95_01670 [Chthoniobacteraceae bacterium]|nr:hypothetical protein [Chthoniobacteraceae bacterium]
MKINSRLATLFSMAITSFAFAAEDDSKQLQAYPKNLARQHLGSNLFLFNPTNQTYVPTEAAAAWLDDDATTGWPIMAGKQNYLLVLSEPELLTSFSISARPATGTISLFAGDEPTAPGSPAWKTLAKDVPFESVNNKRIGKPLDHFAKYLLIQTDIADPGPLYGLYVFGDKPAVDYSLRKREQPIDAHAIFGQYVNNQTDFNLGGLYSGARVTQANPGAGYASWQRAIDDNPETAVTLAPSTNESSAVISFGQPRTISRISLLADTGAKGKLDFFAMKEPAATPGPHAAAAPLSAAPTVSIVLDGTNPRSSIDFPAVQASELAIRWSPVNPADHLNVREIAAFNGATLNDYEVGLSPAAIAERPSGSERSSSEGKDYKDAKKNPQPLALGPNPSPYLPGALGFPPTPTLRRVVIPPSVSP